VSDRSSLLRKRALRRLSHEQYPAYTALYEQVLSEIPGLTRHQVRVRAWTRLRHEFPDRYRELFAFEQCGIGSDVPSDARAKTWQRACARLAELRQAVYRSRYAQFRAQGMSSAKSYDRAIAAVRDGEPDLFARLLAEQYQQWLAVTSAATHPAGEPGSASVGLSVGVAGWGGDGAVVHTYVGPRPTAHAVSAYLATFGSFGASWLQLRSQGPVRLTQLRA